MGTSIGAGISIGFDGGGGGTGDVAGPASSTDNAIVRFDGTTGKLIQNSSATLNDSGVITAAGYTGTGGTVTASTPPVNITQTWNNAGVVFDGILADFTNTASDASSKPLHIKVGGTSVFNVNRSGTGTFAGGVTTGGAITAGSTLNATFGATIGFGSSYDFSGRSRIFSPSDGLIRLANAAGTDFTRLQFGGTTSSFPSIKRNSTALNFRLADDSADAPITAAAGTFSGDVTVSTVNIVTDTTTGTKIGTGATQKLGFWNATPVVQSTGWTTSNVTTDKVLDANATTIDELADVLGTLIEQLKTYGILGA